MKKLSKYIAKRFTLYVLIVYALCLVLIFLIDFVEMIRITSKYSNSTIGQTALITFLRVPIFAEIIFPFSILIGCIGTFLMLSRSSELIVVRASGMSVWQFLLPTILVSILLGILMNIAYNPLAAMARAEAERQFSQTFKRSKSLFNTTNKKIWMRQKGEDGSSILSAKASAEHGLLLNGVTILHYDHKFNFSERIDARQAKLRYGRWELENVLVSTVGRAPENFPNYFVSTQLTPTQVKDSLGSVESVSFWELPKFIKTAENAGLPALRYRLQYEAMLSRPLLFITMVLLAATSSLGAFRFGNIQKMIIFGLGSGFVFFLFAEITKNFAHAGSLSPAIAVWLPCVITSLIAITVLLHQEDG